MTPSLDKLTHFLETQVATIEKPLVVNRPLKKVIANKTRYVGDARFRPLEDQQIFNVISLVNIEYKTYMDQFFASQTIHDISRQVIKKESSVHLRRMEKLMDLNDILICYPVPNLKGEFNSRPVSLDSDDEQEPNTLIAREEFDSSNYNLHGLVNIKKEEILGLIDELPAGDKIAIDYFDEETGAPITISNESREEKQALIAKYESERQKLNANRDRLLLLEEKLKYYRDLKDQLERQLIDKTGSSDLQNNYLVASNQQLINQLNELKSNLSALEVKLQDQGKLERLRRKIMINFEEYD